MNSLLAQLKQSEMIRCVHFRSIANKTCSAGVVYDEVNEPPAPGKPLRMPCYSVGMFAGPDLVCPMRKMLSEDEAEVVALSIYKRMMEHGKARSAAKDDAATRGLKRGNGGRGEIPCPVCNTGKLYYSVASVNGHMHGKCRTAGCVSWME